MLPGKVNSGKLARRQHDFIAGLPGQPAGHSVDAIGSAIGESDFGGASADEPRQGGAGGGGQLEVKLVGDALGVFLQLDRLLLFTKGEPREQRRKVAGTGLGKCFAAREVVPEKNGAAYRAVLARHRLPPATVWMVGDSPRPDINPALAIGLNAVFIPTPHNWEYENEEIRRGRGRLLVLKRFRDLRDHF